MEKKLLKMVGIVAVIGIVFTIIAVYFGYQSYKKFPLKARQGESLRLLADMHKNLLSHKKEFGSFCTDLSKFEDVSVFMAGHLSTKVKFGFTNASKKCEGINMSPQNKDSDILVERGYINYQEIYPDSYGTPRNSFDEVAQKFCSECTAENNSFKLIAFTNLDTDSTLDIWTIDHDKKLINLVNDIEE